MEKTTLSTYGWIIVTVIILSIIIGIAVLFGKQIGGAVDSLFGDVESNVVLPTSECEKIPSAGTVYQWQEYEITNEYPGKLELNFATSEKSDSVFGDKFINKYNITSTAKLSEITSINDFNAFANSAVYEKGLKTYTLKNNDNQLSLVVSTDGNETILGNIEYIDDATLKIINKEKSVLSDIPTRLIFKIHTSKYCDIPDDDLKETRILYSKDKEEYPQNGMYGKRYYKFIGTVQYN